MGYAISFFPRFPHFVVGGLFCGVFSGLDRFFGVVLGSTATKTDRIVRTAGDVYNDLKGMLAPSSAVCGEYREAF